MPPDVLGHLIHGLELKRPKELRVMMSEMSLSRFVQLLVGVSSELRPALAEGAPTVAVLDRGRFPSVNAAYRHLARPTERVGV